MPLRDPGRPRGPGDELTGAYVEACRLARLRRWPGRVGQDVLRLQVGDLYAWREASLPGTQITFLTQYRPVYIAADRLWWLPRLDQLIDRLGAVARQRWPEESARQHRERIGLQLVEGIRQRDQSWEEAALEVLMIWT